MLLIVLLYAQGAETAGLTYSLYKIKKVPPLDFPIYDQLTLYSPKNSSVAFQCFVFAPHHNWNKTEVIVNDFIHTNSQYRITNENIIINPIGNVIIRKDGIISENISLWPDPLLPRGSVDIKKGEVRAFWITINIPNKAEPGSYLGDVLVIRKGMPPITFNVILNIWDFTLPRIPPIKFLVGLDITKIKNFYGIDSLSTTIILDWISFFAERGINADNRCGSYHWNVDPLIVLRPPRPDIAEIQLKGTDFIWAGRLSNKIFNDSRYNNENYISNILDALEAVVDTLSAYDWKDKAILYSFDELNRKEAYSLLEFYKNVNQWIPELTIMQTFLSNRGLLGDHTPLDVLADNVDIWNTHMMWYKRNKTYIDSLKIYSGKKWWWYFTKHGPPWGNIVINDPSVLSHRMLPWLTKTFNFDAILHWESVYFPDKNIRNINNRWPSTTWEASVKRNKKFIYHGNGYLVYPGPDITPLSSIRLEAIRHGIEDVKMLNMLEELYSIVNHEVVPQELFYHVKKLINPSPELIQDVHKFNRDPDIFLQYRTDVGNTIVKLMKYIKGNG